MSTDPLFLAPTLFREVVELNGTSKDAIAFRRLASQRCGAATARSSWAVVADFPLAPMATASQFAFFLADTRSGWKLYRSVTWP